MNPQSDDNRPGETPEELRQSRLTAYALDMLDKHQRDAVELELADDPTMRNELEQISHITAALRDDARPDDALSPSPELSTAIEKRISELENEQQVALTGRHSTPRRSWRVLAVAIALLLAAAPLAYVLLFGQNGFWSSRTRREKSLANMESAVSQGKEPAKQPWSSRSGKRHSDGGNTLDFDRGQATGDNVPKATSTKLDRLKTNLYESRNSQQQVSREQKRLREHVVELERLERLQQRVSDRTRNLSELSVGGRSLGVRGRWGYVREKGFLQDNKRDQLSAISGLEFDYKGKIVADQRAATFTDAAVIAKKLGMEKATVWFEEHKAQAVAFSPDGRYLLASADDGKVRLWDVNGDRPVELPPGALPPVVDGTSGERYEPIVENPFLPTRGKSARSTFSIDVDTASYSNMRRYLNSGSLPPVDAVRIEELVNYFQYDYPQPQKDEPFSVSMETAVCPWKPEHRLLRIGLKGREIAKEKRPASNLVFLLDVSGSMNSPAKLPLLKEAMKFLVAELNGNDTVTIVTYRGNAGLVLDDANGDEKIRIRKAIDQLTPGGSTHGSQGIELAYEKAAAGFIKNGVNRVILATDGDLNVGITDDDALVKLIKEKAKSNVFLTVLGFGTGNLKDAKLEKLADNGNGLYAYIDNLREARKVLVEQIGGSLVTIAKDVKIQLEFNPAEVAAYRLIGYENRLLAARDFDDDTKDAGEIGAGHTVTALYELVPPAAAKKAADKKEEQVGEKSNEEEDDKPLKYQHPADEQKTEGLLTEAAKSGDLVTLALRFKKPDGDKSTRIEYSVKKSNQAFNKASRDFQFASAVASFGMLLRGSHYKGAATFSAVAEIASAATGKDPHGYRKEFLELVRKAQALKP